MLSIINFTKKKLNLIMKVQIIESIKIYYELSKIVFSTFNFRDCGANKLADKIAIVLDLSFEYSAVHLYVSDEIVKLINE